MNVSEVLVSPPIAERLCSELSWKDLSNLLVNKNLLTISCQKEVNDPDRHILYFDQLDVTHIKLANLIEQFGSRNTLIYLIGKDGQKLVREFLQRGVPANFVAVSGSYPLLHATVSADMTKLLLEFGADPNFYKTIRYTPQQMRRIFQEWDERIKGSPLLQAVFRGFYSRNPLIFLTRHPNSDSETVKLLIEAGADLNNFEYDHGFISPLILAGDHWTKNIENLLLLLEAGANLSELIDGKPAGLIMLEKALTKEIQIGLIQLLVKYLPKEDLRLRQNFLFLLASKLEGINPIRTLLKAGLNPNFVIDGSTPLLKALDIFPNVALLLKAGADPNLAVDGISPLLLAIKTPMGLNHGTIELLIKAGAQLTVSAVRSIFEKDSYFLLYFLELLPNVNVRIEGLTLLDHLGQSVGTTLLPKQREQAKILIEKGGSFSPEYLAKTKPRLLD